MIRSAVSAAAGSRLRLGVLYPLTGAEDEYLEYATRAPFPVELRVAFTEAEDSHAPSDLLDAGSLERLVAGARALAPWRPHAITWACTSGSFIGGVEGARAQVEAIGRAADAPAGSTSLAFVEALRALRLRRVALLAPYPPEATDYFVRFLGAFGIEVASLRCLDCPGPSTSSQLSGDDLLSAAVEADTPAAEALLVPDTAVFSLQVVQPLQAQLGKPALAANQVTLWHLLRLAGSQATDPRLGALASVPIGAS